MNLNEFHDAVDQWGEQFETLSHDEQCAELLELVETFKEMTVQTKAATKDFQDTMWCKSALDGLDK